jgi:hypothetical protein
VPRLAPGEHTVEVELASSDHASLSPKVSDSVTFTVGADAQGIVIDQTGFGGDYDSATVWVPVNVSNFTLDPASVSGDAVAGAGHYHVYLDGVYQTYGAGEGVWLYDVAAGAHTIEARLAGNDHAELSDSVDYARLNVAADRPNVRITSPLDGEVVAPAGFNLMAEVENHTLNESAVGAANVDGEGHYHIYVDGLYYNFDTDLSTTITGLDSGEHEVYLELVNNDHTALATPVMSAPIYITVE